MIQPKAIKERMAYVLIACICILLAVRAFYGLDLTDESFYLAVAKRFAEGDRPFREEWFTTQLIGVLLLPLYSIYHWFTGSHEGVILFVRLCYVIFSGSIACFLFYELRKKDGQNWLVALSSAVLYLLYARANIVTLSYYNIGLGTFLMYILLRGRRYSKLADVCAGVSFSVSVLCMPYMVLYFLIVVGLDVKKCVCKQCRWREIASFYAGILFSAVLFLLYVFSSGNLMDIFSNLSLILQDPEHQGTVLESLLELLVFMKTHFYRFLFWPMIAEFLLIVSWRWKYPENDSLKNILNIAAYLLFFVQSVYLRTFFEGGIIIAFLLLALQIALLNGEWEVRLVKKYLIPGILFGFIWVLGSNVGQRVFNMGCVVADIWALQIVWKDIHKSVRFKIIKYLAPVLVLTVLFVIRIFDIYRDSSITQLTVALEEGAGKGIRTTSQRQDEYMAVLDKLQQYADEGKILAVSGNQPWIYLEADAECGSFSTWNLEFADERNDIYYEKYPQKIPDVIFLLNPKYGQYQGWRFTSHGSYLGAREEERLEGWFLELVETGNYRRFEEGCGTFYVR